MEWNAQSKIGSKDNITHKPGGGDKKVSRVDQNKTEREQWSDYPTCNSAGDTSFNVFYTPNCVLCPCFTLNNGSFLIEYRKPKTVLIELLPLLA